MPSIQWPQWILLGKGDTFDPFPASFLEGEKARWCWNMWKMGCLVLTTYIPPENFTVMEQLAITGSACLLDKKGMEKKQALERMLRGYWVDLEGTRPSNQTSWPTGHLQEVKEYATMDRLFFPCPLGIDCGPCYPMKTNTLVRGGRGGGGQHTLHIVETADLEQ